MNTDFTSLGVSSKLAKGLSDLKIVTPTPIQLQAIPAVLGGLDVLAQAQTGTGKTLAFLLPIFDGHQPEDTTVQAMVITPTRELAIQITAEARKLARTIPMTILAAYGGQDIQTQLNRLQGNVNLIIGTPGRILDHIRRGSINLKHLKTLVLDEADQMLHIGFLPEVEAIIAHTPPKRQTLCFSATLSPGVKALAKRFTRQPVSIAVKSEQVTLKAIRQEVIETSDREKQNALIHVIEEQRPFMALVFCRTQRRVTTLQTALLQKGYKCDELHGSLTQAKREKVMKAFRNAELQLLVATDVAARGLDIEGMTHVYNYDIPADTESYIHRIGRTGRAGQKGVAVTFVAPKDQQGFASIEREIGEKLPRRSVKEKPRESKERRTPEPARKFSPRPKESKGGRGRKNQGR